VNLRDPQGCTPLDDAISNAEVAPQEQRHGESTQDDGEKGKYPAQELAAWLIQNGADPAVVDGGDNDGVKESCWDKYERR
jgi:hypothetical protein